MKNYLWIDVLLYLLPFIAFIFLKYSDIANENVIPSGRIVNFYRYFVFGMIVRKYDVLNYLISHSKWVYSIAIMCFFIGCVYAERNNIALIFLSSLGGIITWWFFFRNIRNQNVITQGLSVIGRYTLSIYVFHYFFIPDMKWIMPYIGTNTQLILQLFVCIALCCIIIPLCILIENIIEKNTMLRYFVLGKK